MSKPHIEELIDIARRHDMSPEELAAQVRSFAYGNTHLGNEQITPEIIDAAIAALKAERASK